MSSLINDTKVEVNHSRVYGLAILNNNKTWMTSLFIEIIISVDNLLLLSYKQSTMCLLGSSSHSIFMNTQIPTFCKACATCESDLNTWTTRSTRNVWTNKFICTFLSHNFISFIFGICFLLPTSTTTTKSAASSELNLEPRPIACCAIASRIIVHKLIAILFSNPLDSDWKEYVFAVALEQWRTSVHLRQPWKLNWKIWNQ